MRHKVRRIPILIWTSKSVNDVKGNGYFAYTNSYALSYSYC